MSCQRVDNRLCRPGRQVLVELTTLVSLAVVSTYPCLLDYRAAVRERGMHLLAVPVLRLALAIAWY